ncbi:MAG: universal stress protein [Gammaproteobacteria bacterium]|nr:universal stress protein [Gammaproteobacteria bacterium]
MIHDVKSRHKTAFNEFLGNYDLDALWIKTHLKKGEAAEVALKLAKRNNIDLVIMGTVARTGIPGFFIGNTAERILNSVDSSILAVKPKSFSTPIKK